MKQTKARQLFKKKFGQQNHFLITSLIGLDYIENGDDIKCPDSFSTSWNPRDKKQSARRSRDFLLQSFLSFAVDGIDLYLSELNTAPKYILDVGFTEALCAAERSVYKKVKKISEYLTSDKLLKSLCLVLITYRNNLLHSKAENVVEEVDKDLLLENRMYISENFCRLDIEVLLTKVEKKEPPTFKEVASLIRATQKFVEEIDSQIISRISPDFIYETIKYYFTRNPKTFDKYLCFTEDQRKKQIKNILENSLAIPPSEYTFSKAMLDIKKEDVRVKK